MKRVFLIIGCLLLPLGVLFLGVAGAVGAVELGQLGGPCENCQPVVHLEPGEGLVSREGPEIEFDKTVGLDPSTCAVDSHLTVTSGGDTVYYCYRIENTGDLTLTLHTVIDDKLGTLLGPGFFVNLTPGAIGYFTVEVNITQTTMNSATWTAFNPGPTDVVTDSDTALVLVEGPITALTATNNGPTTIGMPTTFDTEIEGGGFETYAWAFGDNVTGTGAMTSHIYPAIGVYTAVVTATNSLNSMTATTIVTVTHPPVFMPSIFRP